MTTTDRQPIVAFVMSTNYAGSTVLGLAMGRHSRAAFVGEPALLLRRRDDGSFRHRKFCTSCNDEDGARCPVWRRSTIDTVRQDPSQAYDLVWKPLGAPPVLVDASKDLDWMFARAAHVERTRCVHISKPVEAFVASVRVRQKKALPIEVIGLDWVARNREIREECARSSVPYLHVTYEGLALDFEGTMRRVMDFVGLDHEKEQESFWEGQPHYVKGNPGVASNLDASRVEKEPGVNREIYRENHRRIFFDDKWRKLLSSSDVERLYGLPAVADESRTLGYENPLLTSGFGLAAKVRGHTYETGLHLVRAVRRRAKTLSGLVGRR